MNLQRCFFRKDTWTPEQTEHGPQTPDSSHLQSDYTDFQSTGTERTTAAVATVHMEYPSRSGQLRRQEYHPSAARFGPTLVPLEVTVIPPLLLGNEPIARMECHCD